MSLPGVKEKNVLAFPLSHRKESSLSLSEGMRHKFFMKSGSACKEEPRNSLPSLMFTE